MPDRLTRTTPKPKPGIVHLGPGAFFRAFNAVYTHEAMAAAGGDWGIIAVSLRSPTARDQLAPQDGVFTSVTLAPEGAKAQEITSIRDVLVAPESPGAVIAAMADPAIRIVSLTITEKGYCHNPATGLLDEAHPDIAHDLAHPAAPRSALGFLCAALEQRRQSGAQPFTVLSCDNLPANGALARQVVLQMAEHLSPELRAWIAAEVPFPATMVDRITPATTPEDIAHLAQMQGYDDPAMVVHEPFRQWVIEEDFANGHPAWNTAGAQFVASVEAHELMKLRCLNGTHSTLAYLGYLAGFETVSEAANDAVFARLLVELWQEEILPTLPQPEGEDLQAYTDALLTRYQNPAIRHRLWQIAMDGSQKLPQRLLGTIKDHLTKGVVPPRLCLAVAGWMRYVSGRDEQGEPIDVRDPMASLLVTAGEAETTETRVARFLQLEGVFDPELARHAGFRKGLIEALSALETRGARASIEALISKN